MKEASPEPVRILLVDDTLTNLTVLSESIQQEGWNILFATDGEAAIEQAEYAKPDLILLDVMMPGIDGFETCRRLKASAITQDIPIIFMTALSDANDKVKGFQLGAVDYITKPFQQAEVMARVSLQIRLRQMTLQLEQNNALLNHKVEEQAKTETQLQQLTQELERRVEERTAKLTEVLDDLKQAQVHLVQSEKMSSLGQMMAGIAHEINNPVNFIYGNLRPANDYFQDLIGLVQHYQTCYPDPDPDLQKHLDNLDLEFMIEDAYKLLESLKIGADRIRDIVLSLRNFSRLDEASVKAVDIHEGLDSTLLILQSKLKNTVGTRPVEIVRQYGELPPVECYPSQLNQVFMNLVANAIDALHEYHQSLKTESSPNGELSDSSQDNTVIAAPTIRIKTELIEENTALVQIIDNGPGIPEAIRSKLFDPFFTTKPIGKGTGLGLSISHEIIVEKHGGSISCLSHPQEGTRFIIKIPCVQEYSEPPIVTPEDRLKMEAEAQLCS